MTPKHGTARVRDLAAQLKELRERSELTTRQVAARTGFSPSSLNRMENGGKAITVEDTASLLVVYQVVGAERERILDLARNCGFPGWWESAAAPGRSGQLAALVRFENEATKIVHVAMLRIPGLLQLPHYVRSVMATGGVLPDLANSLVEIRMARQKVLTRPHPPHYLVILDESALRRPVGSRELMADQLRHIAAMAARPNIDVRVIPFDKGPHIGMDGSYVLMDFAKARTLVHLEYRTAPSFVDDPEKVLPFQESTDCLVQAALGHPTR